LFIPCRAARVELRPAMLTVAVGWELYGRTHSALALGLVGLTEAVAIFLFTLPAGHLADHYDRKRIQGGGATWRSQQRGPGNRFLAASTAGLVLLAACFAGAAAINIFAACRHVVPGQDWFRARSFRTLIAWNSSTFQLASVLGPGNRRRTHRADASHNHRFILNAWRA